MSAIFCKDASKRLSETFTNIKCVTSERLFNNYDLLYLDERSLRILFQKKALENPPINYLAQDLKKELPANIWIRLGMTPKLFLLPNIFFWLRQKAYNLKFKDL